jgi:hypothetical protein
VLSSEANQRTVLKSATVPINDRVVQAVLQFRSADTCRETLNPIEEETDNCRKNQFTSFHPKIRQVMMVVPPCPRLNIDQQVFLHP